MSWKKWFHGQTETSPMSAKEIPLGEVRGWGIETSEGFLDFEEVAKKLGCQVLRVCRPDGRFFSIIGINIEKAGSREVKKWDQVIVKEFGQGKVRAVIIPGQEPMFVVTVKPEPGNSDLPGMLMIQASLSASQSNIEQAHGGEVPPGKSLLMTTDHAFEISSVKIQQDGGRFSGKLNSYSSVGYPSYKPTPDEFLMTAEDLLEAYEAGYVSEHLAQALFGGALKMFVEAQAEIANLKAQTDK